MTGLTSTMGKKEFALSQGWSPSYVTELAGQGRLVLVGEGRNARVDVAASLKRIAETASGNQPGVVARHAENRAGRSNRAASEETEAGEGSDIGGEVSAAPGHEEGRLAIRKYRELITREERLIDLGLMQGELLHRGDVDHLWHDLGVAVRASLEAMIERLAPKLAACIDQASVSGEIRAALREERVKLKRLLLGTLRQAKVQ